MTAPDTQAAARVGRAVRVLVTDGHQRAALAAVRALKSAGRYVFVCSPELHCLAGSSAACTEERRVADALAQPAAFVEQIRGLVAELRIDVVLPITEAAILALRGATPPFVEAPIAAASLQQFNAIADKENVLRNALDLGIATPAQCVIQTAGEAMALAPSLTYPIVVKPSRSVSGPAGDRQKFGVQYANDGESLLSLLQALHSAAFPVLLQSKIVGLGAGVFVFMRAGELRAHFAHQRLLEKPPTGGVSVLSVSVPVGEALLQRSVQLLRRLRWDGCAMVEYKIDEATGVPYLMEINGRLWGSLQLAIDSGVNFPDLLVASVLAEERAEQRIYRTGVVSVWWWGLVDHMVARLRLDARAKQDLPTLRALYRLERGGVTSVHNELLRADDPAPFFLETARWASHKLRRLGQVLRLR